MSSREGEGVMHWSGKWSQMPCPLVSGTAVGLGQGVSNGPGGGGEHGPSGGEAGPCGEG